MYDWYAIQAQLKRLGFYAGKIDGLRGPLTNQAIVAFKKSIGFRARDYYGPLTHKALMGPGTVPTSGVAPWMAEAKLVLGLHEVRDNARLRGWFDRSVSWINPKEIPWCGAFLATCLRKVDPDMPLPANPLGARQWGTFGESVNPQYGAVLTFWRVSRSSWQGHAAFCVGEDSDAYHVLGGNQSNAVTVTRMAKYRLLQARWPSGYPQSKSLSELAASGELSTNEA